MPIKVHATKGSCLRMIAQQEDHLKHPNAINHAAVTVMAEAALTLMELGRVEQAAVLLNFSHFLVFPEVYEKLKLSLRNLAKDCITSQGMAGEGPQDNPWQPN